MQEKADPRGSRRRTRRSRYGRGRAGAAGVLLVGVMLLCCPDAFALDPALDVSQYAHTAWRVRDGFMQGTITAMAQTRDGYLWVGTEFGLYRFDGVRAVPWQPPAGQQLPGNRISNLLVARDGTLWISTIKGLASWKDGKLMQYSELAGQLLNPLLEDREGTIWIGAFNPGRLCAIRSGKAQCYGEGSFGVGIWNLYEDHQGNLWAISVTGLWRWDSARPEHYSIPGQQIDAIIETEGGDFLLATSKGLKRLADGKIQDYALPGIAARFRPLRFFRSSDGSLWVASAQGLLHLHQGRTDTFGTADGLSGDFVGRMIEDREGNVWVSTTTGLDRFREYAIPTVSRSQGLSTSGAYSIQATSNGTIWIGTINGLNQWRDGRVTVYGGQTEIGKAARNSPQHGNGGLASNPQGLGLDDQGRICVSTQEGTFYFDGDRFVRVPGARAANVWSIAGDGHGKLWMNDGTAGLYYFTPGEAVRPIPWSRFGQKGFGAQAILPDHSNGGIWLALWDGGIVHFRDGEVRASYSAANGLGNGRATDLRFGSRGTLWVGTEGGLSRIRDGRVMTLTNKNGLPCDTVLWSMEDDDHFVWVYMSCGLVRIARSELDDWVRDPGHKVQARIFDVSDGVRTISVLGGYGPHATKAPDGRIWFAAYDGVNVIDPRHLPFNKLLPPVHIEQITADRKSYETTPDASGRVPLPARIRDLQIDYTALSLVATEKVRFRYKLEGRDSDWQDAGNRRQAFYTDLPPRNYRFRVMACNNSGVWNEAGAVLDFSVAPAYYQTWWFRLTLVAAFLAVLWGLYQQRLQQLAREFNAGADARVSERTRIARELHDSLLQGFQGMMFRLQAVRDMLPESSEAAQALDVALERGDKAIAEGRDTVSDLREPIMGGSDIAQALTALGKELAAQSGNGLVPCVRVLVEGKQRELDPVLRDEIYRIGREALRNAFRHSRAQKIEAEITYGDAEFLLHVRDDGSGIDAAFANQGSRAGHWGLPGMRERAKGFGGKLEVWSEDGAGTEIELSVPAAIAYGKSDARRRFWSRRKKIEETNEQ